MADQNSNGVWSYHHYDARGHCILLTGSSGTLVEQYSYDAFGKVYYYDGAGYELTDTGMGNRFLFTGREWISELKLYDFRNRMYQPELGRFIQPDPKEFGAGDYNLYRYCHNDPVNKNDPTGLDYYALGPQFSFSLGLQFSISGQFFVSTPYRLTDVANYRIGVSGSITPLTGSSTGIGGAVGVVATHSTANSPQELTGGSGTFGASANLGVAVGYDRGNVGSMKGNTPAPQTDNRFLGVGLKVSPAALGAPVEGHAAKSFTGSYGASLGEIYGQEKVKAPEEKKAIIHSEEKQP